VPNETISVSDVIPADPEQIYAAWLSTEEHSAFTGDEASVEPFVGGKHSSFGGYAIGTTVELDPGRRIVQTWRSRDFPEQHPDSRVEVTLEETDDGTLVTILHTELPESQGDRYRDGWVKWYLEALKKYFGAGSLDDDDEGDEEAADEDQPSAPAAAAASDYEDDEDDEAAAPTPPPPPPRKAPPAKKSPAVKAKAKPAAKAKTKAKPAKARIKARPSKSAAAKKAKKPAKKAPAKKSAPRAKAKAKGKGKRR
jgi:uncharacterized protein YndB with AHSA1/START domain